MTHQQTYTVAGSYIARDKTARVYLNGLPGSFPAAETFDEGSAVVIVNGRAVRARS